MLNCDRGSSERDLIEMLSNMLKISDWLPESQLVIASFDRWLFGRIRLDGFGPANPVVTESEEVRHAHARGCRRLMPTSTPAERKNRVWKINSKNSGGALDAAADPDRVISRRRREPAMLRNQPHRERLLMSNPMYLSRTRFETLDHKGVVASTSYGARLYDDIGCAYSNFIETLQELIALDADGLIDYMRENSESARNMIDMVRELGDPLYVDDELYSCGGDEEADADHGEDALVIGPDTRPVTASGVLEIEKAIMRYFAGVTGRTNT
jgi:hypothetical protein